MLFQELKNNDQKRLIGTKRLYLNVKSHKFSTYIKANNSLQIEIKQQSSGLLKEAKGRRLLYILACLLNKKKSSMATSLAVTAYIFISLGHQVALLVL